MPMVGMLSPRTVPFLNRISPCEICLCILLHHHVGEQPFTHRQSGIMITPGITRVSVKAHDSIKGFGGQEIIVDFEIGNGNGCELGRLL